jgi:serine/threonine-protein kinase
MSFPLDVSLLQAVERRLPDGFTIQEQIGAGATSWVYRASRSDAAADAPASAADASSAEPAAAERLATDDHIIVKVMRSGTVTPARVDRFVREMRILQKLSHPRIVPILEPGEVDGALYFTMPYVRGETLRASLDRHGPLTVQDALDVAHDLADALGHAHAQGVVHRDVKPENILLSTGGAYLLDFGFASAPSLTSDEAAAREAREMVGTPDYVSPEEVSGARAGDWRSDFYSLGCVLFEMLAGQPPFTGGSPRATSCAATTPAPDVRTFPAPTAHDVAFIVRRCLERSPNDRFPTASFLACRCRRRGRGRRPRVGVARSPPWLVAPTPAARVV